MTEVRGDDQEFFRALEAIQMDPAITRVFDKILLYQDLLADSPVSVQYINQIMNELDNGWRTHMKRPAIFTGLAYFPDKSDPEGVARLERHENTPVFFHGVMPCEDEDRNIGISIDDPRYYNLRVLLGRVEDDIALKGTARPEDIMGLDFPNVISFERAQHVLENFQPGMLYSLQDSLTKPAIHEGKLARRLGKYFYDPSNDDPENAELTRMSLDCYTHKMLQFDSSLGYSIDIKGRAWGGQDDALYLVKVNAFAPAKVDHVTWQRSPKKHDDTIVPHLRLQLYTDDLNDSGERLYVPLASVRELVPHRYLHWQTQQKP